VKSRVFFAVLFFVGAAATATDWRERRVPNRLVFLGLGAFGLGVSYHLAASLLGHHGWRVMGVGEYYMPWRFFKMLAVHSLLSLAAGLTLWRLDVWPAGDAKLYIVLSWLMPLVDANLGGFPRLLFLVILINSFVPPGVLFAAEAVARSLSAFAARVSAVCLDPRQAAIAAVDRARVRAADLWSRRWRALVLVVNLAALFLVLQLVMSSLPRASLGPIGTLLAYFGMFAAWSKLSSLLRRPLWGGVALLVFFGASAVASALGQDLVVLLWRTAKNVVGFGLFLSLARGIFERVLERASVSEVPADDLRAGVLLTDEAHVALSSDPEAAPLLGDRNCDGMTAEGAVSLRSLLRVRGQSSLSIYRGVPFAAWIFLGAVMTLWRPGTVVTWATIYGRTLPRYLYGALEKIL